MTFQAHEDLTCKLQNYQKKSEVIIGSASYITMILFSEQDCDRFGPLRHLWLSGQNMMCVWFETRFSKKLDCFVMIQA